MSGQHVVGILGGFCWESTSLYYSRINTMVKQALGGLHSAELLLYSLDFAAIEEAQHKGDWDGAAAIMGRAAKSLADAGAKAIVIATNTMHKRADDVAAASGVPVLHIADATAAAIVAAGLKRPLLLATAFTMEETFYKGRLIDGFGLDPVVPDAEDRALIHRVIYDELCQGIVQAASKQAYLDVIARYRDAVDCVILGCTEITMLIGAEDTDLPVFDTTEWHARAATDFLLKGEV
ncbi:MAG: aspartate/glutamate racemase family protein [Alphaproteobacteria bacterium]|nr:aspartate/glutamate racemase family protein [Alphaproteobacteria bacterium]